MGQPNCTYKGHFTHETESPWPLHFKHSRWWKRRSRSKFTSCYTWGTNRVCEVYIDSYMASNGPCFMVTWIVFENHFLEVGLTQTGRPGTLNAHNLWFILFYHVWGHAWIKNHWNSISLRAQSHMTSHYTWGTMTTLYDLGVHWDGLWTLSFGFSQFHGHGSWLMCEVALIIRHICLYSM